MSEGDPLLALAAEAMDAWLVGGALRDRLLGRATADYDVAVAGDPASLARGVARRTGGHAFLLSEGFRSWRVVVRQRDWQVDVLPVVGGAIETDLAARDFTVDALALPLRELARTKLDAVGPIGRIAGLLDPYGGLSDLRARRLRMVSPQAFERDPVRILRLARLACELAFAVGSETREAARRNAARLEAVAAERVFGELKRILCSDRPLQGLDEMDALGATERVIPEVAALRGTEGIHDDHPDAYEHTRAVLTEVIALARDPEPAFGDCGPAVRAVLSRPLADELTRAQGLRFGALLHGIAKPAGRVDADGRASAMVQDVEGAALASEVLGRLRASDRLRQYVAALTEHRLLFGYLAPRAPLCRREIYRYLHGSEPVQVDVTVLGLADRLASPNEGSRPAADIHLAVARQVIAEALAWGATPPRPPLRGDELVRGLGIPPGPELGLILEELREASFVGEVATRDEALELAAQLYRGRSQ